jgi:A/G-specific adenine glycosylase
MSTFFKKALLEWHITQNKRQMPWKGELDPYKIWLSEIILQQTKVEQGLKYYELFVKKFPTIKELATAKDALVFKMWEGLGYYSRCRNLLHTAKYISQELGGIFPSEYQDIKKLKGVGDYTASAIASFAYNKPFAVLDGNVYRILARFFGQYTAIDSKAGKQLFAHLAQNCLDKKNPRLYNQAIMDFGATVCKPKLANCSGCVLQKKCVAFQTQSVYELPVKLKKLTIQKRFIEQYIILYNNNIAVRKRTGRDVWQDLYEFYAIEASKPNNENQDRIAFLKKIRKVNLIILAESMEYEQKLTHQLIKMKFFVAKLLKPLLIDGMQWVSTSQMEALPFPAIVNEFLKKEGNLLNVER